MSDPNQPPVLLEQAEPPEPVRRNAAPFLRSLSQEEAADIAKLVLQPDIGTTENEKYGRRFQLVHLSVFFLVLDDAKLNNEEKLESYLSSSNIEQVYNFRDSVAYEPLFDSGFNPFKFVNDKNTKLANSFLEATENEARKTFFLEFTFSDALGDYLSHPIFKTFALNFAALTCHLETRDKWDGIISEKSRLQKLLWELFGWMFEFFSRRLDIYLKKLSGAPGKQWISEKKFFQARKEYYMSLDFDSNKTALVAYCYHILAIYIERHPNMESNLMILIFTDLRKIKVKLQGTAQELDQTAMKALKDAEYNSLTKVLGLDQWKIFFGEYRSNMFSGII